MIDERPAVIEVAIDWLLDSGNRVKVRNLLAEIDLLKAENTELLEYVQKVDDINILRHENATKWATLYMLAYSWALSIGRGEELAAYLTASGQKQAPHWEPKKTLDLVAELRERVEAAEAEATEYKRILDLAVKEKETYEKYKSRAELYNKEDWVTWSRSHGNLHRAIHGYQYRNSLPPEKETGGTNGHS